MMRAIYVFKKCSFVNLRYIYVPYTVKTAVYIPHTRCVNTTQRVFTRSWWDHTTDSCVSTTQITCCANTFVVWKRYYDKKAWTFQKVILLVLFN